MLPSESLLTSGPFGPLRSERGSHDEALAEDKHEERLSLLHPAAFVKACRRPTTTDVGDLEPEGSQHVVVGPHDRFSGP